ncbi:hypothetical protein BgiBS90_006984, partial [Biomphalaria glabrata]
MVRALENSFLRQSRLLYFGKCPLTMLSEVQNMKYVSNSKSESEPEVVTITFATQRDKFGNLHKTLA